MIMVSFRVQLTTFALGLRNRPTSRVHRNYLASAIGSRFTGDFLPASASSSYATPLPRGLFASIHGTICGAGSKLIEFPPPAASIAGTGILAERSSAKPD
jgi:hypothetical protein